jgi:hypothetical protein
MKGRATSNLRPTFETSKWMTMRFERGTRYYRLHLEQDLWGVWCLTRVNGRSDSRLGRSATGSAGSFQDALELLVAAAERRRARRYELRSMN